MFGGNGRVEERAGKAQVELKYFCHTPQSLVYRMQYGGKVERHRPHAAHWRKVRMT